MVLNLFSGPLTLNSNPPGSRQWETDMNRRDLTDPLLASLQEAAFDDTLWPAASRQIDEACGASGSSVIVGEGVGNDARVSFAAFYRRGERRLDLERDYYENYYHRDERVPRLMHLRVGKLVRNVTLFDTRELKTSTTWNEALPRAGTQNGLNVRLLGLHGLRVTWVIADPVEGDWETGRIRMIRHLLPHIRNFVRVRQALAGAQALSVSFTHLLRNACIGVIYLDRRGRIAETNDPARDILRQGNGLWEQGGFLRAWLRKDDTRLKQLVVAALPTLGGQGVGGSMPVRHPFFEPVLTLHVHPVTTRQMDFGAPDAGALVLIDGLARPQTLHAGQVGSVLGLTPAESGVAVELAAGRTVPDIAARSGRAESSVRTHLKHIHRKLGVSRRADLVRLVLSVPERAGLRLRP